MNKLQSEIKNVLKDSKLLNFFKKRVYTDDPEDTSKVLVTGKSQKNIIRKLIRQDERGKWGREKVNGVRRLKDNTVIGYTIYKNRVRIDDIYLIDPHHFDEGMDSISSRKMFSCLNDTAKEKCIRNSVFVVKVA